MGEVIQTIKKNLKVLLKNKLSLVILFLGPILIISIMGFFYYNSNVYNINIGINYPDEKNNTDINLFITSIKNSGFNIIEYKDINLCSESIKGGVVHACIVFPEGFKIEENKTNQITVKLDGSKGDIISITENLLLDQIAKASEEIQIKYTQDLINAVEFSENQTLTQKDNLQKLKIVNSKIKNSNSEIEKQLVQLTFTFRPEKMGVLDVESRIDSFNTSMFNFIESTIEILNQSDTYLSNISFILSSSNESENNELRNLVDDTQDEVRTAIQKTQGMKADYHFRKLTEDFTKLSETLTETKEKFDELTNTIDKSINSNSDISTSLDTSIDELISSNNNILNEVAKIQVRDSLSIVRPIEIKIDNVIPNSKVHLTSLLPSLIVSLIFIISIILSSTFVLSERKNMAFFRNFMTKTSAFKFLLSDFLTLVFIVFTQISIIIFIYYIVFVRSFTKEIIFLEIAIIPIISIFVLCGMFVGYLTKNESSNVILSFFIILIVLAFSGFILPIEILSASLIKLTLSNPYLISESIVRKIILFGSSFSSLKFEFLMLSLYLVLMFLVNFILESFSKKRWLYQAYVSLELKFKNRKNKEE